MIQNIFYIMILLLCENNYAKSMYFAVGQSLSAVMSESEYNNGAMDSTQSYYLGYRWESLSVEMGYRNCLYSQNLQNSFGNFDISIRDEQYLLGVKFKTSEILYMKLGVEKHRLGANYLNDSGNNFVSVLDGEFFGFYLGAGLDWNPYDHLYLFLDGIYHKASSDISTLGAELGLKYYFY